MTTLRRTLLYAKLGQNCNKPEYTTASCERDFLLSLDSDTAKADSIESTFIVTIGIVKNIREKPALARSFTLFLRLRASVD